MKIATLAAALAAFWLTLVVPASAQAPDPENTLILELKDGPVTIRLRPDIAPQHVERLKTLARAGLL